MIALSRACAGNIKQLPQCLHTKEVTFVSIVNFYLVFLCIRFVTSSLDFYSFMSSYLRQFPGQLRNTSEVIQTVYRSFRKGDF